MKNKAKRKVFICPKCGLPNIVGDSRCMYCEEKVTRIQMFVLWFKGLFQTKGTTPKQQHQQQQTSQPSGLQKVTVPLIGIGIILFGIFLFITGILQGSFQNWIVSILCFLTGYQLLKSKD